MKKILGFAALALSLFWGGQLYAQQTADPLGDSPEKETAPGEVPQDLETNPALLEGGEQFDQGGRNIFDEVIAPSGTKRGPRAEGLPGMDINRVVLQGILMGGLGNVALLLGSDKQLYHAKVNQRFYDGVLIAIERNKVVFKQEDFNELGQPRPPIRREKLLHKKKRNKRLKIADGGS